MLNSSSQTHPGLTGQDILWRAADAGALTQTATRLE
jgi:hypothetical protein